MTCSAVLRTLNFAMCFASNVGSTEYALSADTHAHLSVFQEFLATIGISYVTHPFLIVDTAKFYLPLSRFIEAVITAINSRLFLMLYTAARSAAAQTHISHGAELDYLSEPEFDDLRSTYSDVDVGPLSQSRPGSSKGAENGPPGYYFGSGGNGKTHPPKAGRGKGNFGESVGEVYVMTERATKAL